MTGFKNHAIKIINFPRIEKIFSHLNGEILDDKSQKNYWHFTDNVI